MHFTPRKVLCAKDPWKHQKGGPRRDRLSVTGFKADLELYEEVITSLLQALQVLQSAY